MTNFNDISHIEAWLKGEMNADDRQAFENQLESDPELRNEVETYRRIFEGFQGWRAEKFASVVSGWTQDAKSKQSDTGKIVPMKQVATRLTLWRKLAVAASFILLLGIAAVRWSAQQYSDVKLASNAYRPPLASGTMGNQEPLAGNLERSFELGHEFFQKGNYADAARQFESVILTLETNPEVVDGITRKFFLENSKWSKLLSQFAAGQLTDEEFSAALHIFANDPASDYAENAKKLQRDLDSVWRKIKN